MASSASGGFSMFGGRTEKWENAADLYTQAANAFRMQKQSTFNPILSSQLRYPSSHTLTLPRSPAWLTTRSIDREAGAAFEKAAEIQKSKLSEPDDMANTLTEAFKVYRKDSPEDAARCLTTAIAHYTSKGSFRRAATHQQNLGEVYELELGDTARALQAYETAAQWFESDNAEALANKLYLKVADLAALEGDYAKSCQLFESVARSSLNSNLMRWSVKDYFLKAGICHLASGDLVATNRALQSYRDMDNSFVQTREHMLLQDLVEAVEKGEQEMFADKLFQYDQLSKLDKWKTTLLLKVKNSIEEQGEDFS